MTSISRRTLVTRSAAVLAASAIVGVPAGHAATGTPARRKVVITLPHSSQFDEVMSAHFPALVHATHFAALRPICFFVTNESSMPVVAHSLHFKISSSAGAYETVIPYFFAPKFGRSGSPTFGRSGNRTRMTGQVNLIGISGVRLASPLFNWGPAYIRNNGLPSTAALVTSARADLLLKLLPSITRVEARTEATVFADHSVVGRDSSDLAMTVRVRRNAEHDAASSLLGLIARKAPAEDIEHRLMLHATRTTDSKGNAVSRLSPNAFLYHETRQRHARILNTRLKRDGYDKFVRTVNYLSRQPKTITTYLDA